MGHGAVELGMRRAGLQGISGRARFRRIPNVATASDLVDRQFQRSEPDRLWVTDITEHRTREGKVYCAVVLDIPQSSATALRAWHDHTNRVRSSKSTNHSGMRIQNLAYTEPRTPQSLRLPGEVQFGERGR